MQDKSPLNERTQHYSSGRNPGSKMAENATFIRESVTSATIYCDITEMTQLRITVANA